MSEELCDVNFCYALEKGAYAMLTNGSEKVVRDCAKKANDYEITCIGSALQVKDLDAIRIRSALPVKRYVMALMGDGMTLY